jgi:mono/diheme cytochrome c family protein
VKKDGTMNKKTRILFLALLTLAVAGLLSAAAAAGPQDVPDDVKAIFAKHCAGCHKGKNPPTGLSWEPDQILSAVDAPSRGVPASKIIDSASPEKSYLLKKVGGGSGMAGRSMPPGRALTKDEIATLTAWLEGLKKTPD